MERELPEEEAEAELLKVRQPDVDDGGPLEFTIPLEYDDLRSRQLGSRVYKNAAAYQTEPRREVTAVRSGTLAVRVRRRRLRYGVAKNDEDQQVPAALVIFDLSFQRLSTSRFNSAEIEIDLEDAATLAVNAHDVRLDPTHQPAVLRWEPRLFQGPITQVVGQSSLGLKFAVSDPSNMVGVSASSSSVSPVVREGNFVIHGVAAEDPASSVCWGLLEDDTKKTGLPAEMPIGIIVACTPGRKFAARVRARARVWHGFRQLVAGERDDPLFFLPPTDTPQVPLEEELAELRSQLDSLFPKEAARIIAQPLS